nr:MAG TPA: Vta1-like protein [Caudoviricetes sp.]
MGTKLNVNIGGLSLQFDDVNQAIGVLEDKLY